MCSTKVVTFIPVKRTLIGRNEAKYSRVERIYACGVIRGLRTGGLVAMVAFTGLLIVACGGSSSTASKAAEVHTPSPSPSPTPSNIAKVDACSLVHQDEATSLAGTPVANLATSQGAQIPGICFYATPDGKTASVVIFGQVFPDSATASGYTPGQIAAAINSGNTLSAATPVLGIGDKAVEYSFTSAQGNGLAIVVFKSNVLFVIAVTPAPSSKALEDLARTAASRL
jgi:hypothetical protein